MNKKDILKRILLSACVYYTVTTFLLIFLFWLISNDITRAMHPVALMLILPFSIAFAAANKLFATKSIARWKRVLSHYAITMSGVFLFLFLPNMTKGQSAGGAFLLLFVLTLIYVAIMAPILRVEARVKRITRDEQEYVSVYKN